MGFCSPRLVPPRRRCGRRAARSGSSRRSPCSSRARCGGTSTAPRRRASTPAGAPSRRRVRARRTRGCIRGLVVSSLAAAALAWADEAADASGTALGAGPLGGGGAGHARAARHGGGRGRRQLLPRAAAAHLAGPGPPQAAARLRAGAEAARCSLLSPPVPLPSSSCAAGRGLLPRLCGY